MNVLIVVAFLVILAVNLLFTARQINRLSDQLNRTATLLRQRSDGLETALNDIQLLNELNSKLAQKLRDSDREKVKLKRELQRLRR